MIISTPRAREEWRNYWYLPFVAALGYGLSGQYVFLIGPFMQPLQQEFGWSRTEVTTGLMIASLIVGAGAVIIGAAVDRLGPRRLALIGTPMMCGAIALLGSATGSLLNWILLWMILAASSLCILAPVWVSAVASRFEEARGLALGITLSGSSVAAAIVPFLATMFIVSLGWRNAFVAMGACLAIATIPWILLFFRGARDAPAAVGARSEATASGLPGLTLRQATRRRVFYQLLLACALLCIAVIGTVAHFVPLLVDRGAAPMQAAGAAALIGAFSLIGRLGTGALLDRYPGQFVGAITTLLPVGGAALLLWYGQVPAAQFIAAAAFGLSVGSEVDIVVYLASRHFGLKHFGVIVGCFAAAIAVGASVGPIAASAAFDHFGSYSPFLSTTIGLAIISSVLLFFLGNHPNWSCID